MNAAEVDCEDCVRLLLKAGADIFIKDSEGRTAISFVKSDSRTEELLVNEFRNGPDGKGVVTEVKEENIQAISKDEL